MQALTYWKTVTMDHAGFLEKLLDILLRHDIRYCVIGGQAVNAYVDPVVSLDLDIVVAVDQLETAAQILAGEFDVKEFPHSLNVYMPDSDIRVQIQTDARYADFPARAKTQEVLGLAMSVATVEDALQGKIWAALDPDRRPSKRQKDLADIARLTERYPELRPQVPTELLERLF